MGFAGAVLLGTGACQGGGEQSAPAGTAAPGATPGAAASPGATGGAAGGEPVELAWWDYYTGSNEQAVQTMHEAYMEANPNITISRRSLPFADLKRTLLQGATADELPDIAIIDNPDHQAFAELGILEDLTARIDEWGQAGEYFEGPWNSTVYNDINYGIPDNSNCLTLWCNMQMLEEAGVEPPANWDELQAAAAALTQGSRYGLAVSAVQTEEGTFQWLPFLWQSGEDIPTLDSEGGRAALQLWVDLVNNGHMSQGILGWEQADVKDQFVAGQAAMMVNGPWQIPVIAEEAPDLDWQVFVLPEGQESASILGGENQAVIAGGEHVDTAWELMQWWQEPDRLKAYLMEAGKLPSREELAAEPEWSEDPALAIFVEQLRVARPRAYGANYPEISNAISLAIQAAISGESDVASALSEAQSTIDPLLA